MSSRWIVLASDGRHVTVAVVEKPTAEKLALVKDGLIAQGLGGWLCDMTGEYYGRRKVTIDTADELAPSAVNLDVAVAAFHAIRKAAVS